MFAGLWGGLIFIHLVFVMEWLPNGSPSMGISCGEGCMEGAVERGTTKVFSGTEAKSA